VQLTVGRELFRTSRVFRETVLSLDAVYKNVTGKSLIADYGIFDSSPSPIALGDIWPIAITLPSITMVQIALTETLASLNIKPDYVAGHSAGETAVLYASGIGSKEMAMELSIARGQGMAPMEDKEGTMAALACTVAQANKIIAAAKLKSSGTLEIGCYNSDDSVTLSGARSAIDVAVQIASDDGMFARVLRTRCPVHSSMMELCSEHYQRLVKAVFDKYPTQAPTIPVYSSKTGRLLDEPMDAEYFWTNTKGPVRFSESMHILLASAKDVCFVELSPHPVLSSYLSSMAPPGTVVVSPLRRANPKKKEKDVEVASLFATVGQTYTTAGHSDIDLLALAGSQDGLLAKLPAYPFAPKQLPMFTPSSVVTRYRQARNGPLNYPQLRVNSQTHPSLAQHIIKGEPIMPAAGYIEMVTRAYGSRSKRSDHLPGSRVWSA
jgi:acyl transferase domain-containing protein